MKFKSLILVIAILLSAGSFNCLAASNRDKAFEELERDTGGRIEQPRIEAPVQPAPSVPLQQNREPAVPANTYDTGSSREIVTSTEVNEAEETNSSVANRASQHQSATPIQFGTGVYDITGPAAEVAMMGYANIDQVSAGISQRLYARAYVFADTGGRRVVFVSAELGQLFGSIKQGVIRKLLADPKLGKKYNYNNVQLSATHTHAGPGGYSHHAMFNFTSLGYIKQNYEVIVEGITKAIVMAHNNLAQGTIALGTGDLNDASINRSIVAFKNNPEVAGITTIDPLKYPSTNPEITQLRLDRSSGPAGAISWFSVHNTSLSRNNRLISSDHKGYAAYLFEKLKGTIQPYVNSGQFIAAFPNGDEGDQSPNTKPGFVGPGAPDEFLSMKIIGKREFDVAHSIYNGNNNPVLGEIDFRHTFVKMPGYVVTSGKVNGAGKRTLCDGAYGFSFAAGAEDGPSGVSEFTEGMTYTPDMEKKWARLSSIFNTQIIPQQLNKGFNTVAKAWKDECQLPKPVLVPSSNLGLTGDILPFQILRLGNVAIAGVPGEMTVQAGRRLREHILSRLSPLGVNKIILTGLANDYSGYITTPEEYDTQQYEGASTLFGRLTLDAYMQIFGQLALDMTTGKSSLHGPIPPDLSQKLIIPHTNLVTLQTDVIYDDKPALQVFGQALKQPPVSVKPGGVVDVTFRAGHPKNNLMTGSSYYLIERQNPNGQWTAKVWDSIPEGRFIWRRDTDDFCKACSYADVHWDVPQDAQPGTYRISHKGAWKNGVTGRITDYQGYTNTFVVGSTQGNASPVTFEQNNATPCGREGQRGCCVSERDKGLLGKPCLDNLNEVGSCTGPNCACGGNNPNGIIKSIGICSRTPPPPIITIKPAPAPVISACGGLNQRACCASERKDGVFGKPCTGSLIERGRCTGASCTCGGANPGGALKSIGMCVR